MINNKAIQAITNIIISEIDPLRVYLIGSYAREEATEDSDVDLLIVSKREDIPKFGRATSIRTKLLGVAGVALDISIFTPSEIEERKKRKFSFINKALKSAKILYEA